MAKARTHQTDVGGFPEYSPAGGIRLPFQEAATSECRRFWAVLTQGNLLDRASTLIVSSCTKGSNKSLGERHARIISDRPAFLQRGGQEVAQGCHHRNGSYLGISCRDQRSCATVEDDPIRTFAPASSCTRQSHNFFVLAGCSITPSALTSSGGSNKSAARRLERLGTANRPHRVLLDAVRLIPRARIRCSRSG